MHLLLLLLLPIAAFCSGIEDYFRNVENKRCHSLPSIDFIYMINLDERPEKFIRSCDQLKEFDIEPCRFSAINGWNLTKWELNVLGVKQGLYGAMSKNMTPGAVGCALSHLSIIQDAYDSGYETVWIMEDDILIHEDPWKLLDLIDELDFLVGKEGWDLLFTDPDIKDRQGNPMAALKILPRINGYGPKPEDILKKKRKINDNLFQTGGRFGMHSYILRRSGMRKILTHFKENSIYIPFDDDIWHISDLNAFIPKEDIVSMIPGGLSDTAFCNFRKKRGR